VVADSNNRVQEITDYTPFGSINNHDQLAGYFSLRKYAGQVYDNSTGLSYMDARYQNPTLGRFMSEDPSFLALDGKSQDLNDPQKSNSYSYVTNNPIKYVDPDGREVYETANIAGGTFGVGTHEFYYIAPENPADIHIPNVPSGITAFTIGGFPSGPQWNPGNLIVQYGYAGKQGDSSDYDAAVSGQLRGTPVKIDYKKAGYKTEAELINAMGRAANSASGGNTYGGLGNLWGAFGTPLCNSNCFNQNIAYRTGILNQIASFNPPGLHPGSGSKVLPAPSPGLADTVSRLLNEGVSRTAIISVATVGLIK
jgi:RHS repeat-associated protein